MGFYKKGWWGQVDITSRIRVRVHSRLGLIKDVRRNLALFHERFLDLLAAQLEIEVERESRWNEVRRKRTEAGER